jgi:hypothetical protein
MKLQQFFLVVVVTSFCIGVGSCAQVSNLPQLELEVSNSGSRSVQNTFAKFGDNLCSWGWVSAGATKSYLHFPHPITPDAEMHWDEEGKHRVEKLDLRKIYPPGKSGRLTFTVHDDRVEVTFREKTPKP